MVRTDTVTPSAPPEIAADALLEHFHRVRRLTDGLCEPLATEDYVIQTMPSVSPTKWHLAHTSWFFETLLLERWAKDYRPYDERYAYLFNSYYNSLGPFFDRDSRGTLSRPTVEEIRHYRRHVESAVETMLSSAQDDELEELAPVLELGLHHEQQHQELLLTDIKHVLASNPLQPAYVQPSVDNLVDAAAALEWLSFEGGLRRIGHDGVGFAYDNELPRHRCFLEPFRLASRLVTNRELLSFLADDGYRRPELWLSAGWSTVQSAGWTAPLYWQQLDDGWHEMSLLGLRRLREADPASHLSYYEADAFARWSGKRLPTEAEWEVAAEDLEIEGNFVDERRFHPTPAPAGSHGLVQLYGDVWEWTQSPYSSYPGYRPAPDALGEYNGKFMCNQLVLRGGSCASSKEHLRASYRNFFEPEARWQFSGLRLADDG